MCALSENIYSDGCWPWKLNRFMDLCCPSNSSTTSVPLSLPLMIFFFFATPLIFFFFFLLSLPHFSAHNFTLLSLSQPRHNSQTAPLPSFQTPRLRQALEPAFTRSPLGSALAQRSERREAARWRGIMQLCGTCMLGISGRIRGWRRSAAARQGKGDEQRRWGDKRAGRCRERWIKWLLEEDVKSWRQKKEKKKRFLVGVDQRRKGLRRATVASSVSLFLKADTSLWRLFFFNVAV